jgi:hypothetical protein
LSIRPYLNAVEHDHPYPPEDFIIEQLAKIVGISPDVLYFHANRQPPDVKTEAGQEQVEAAYRAFRKARELDRASENSCLAKRLSGPRQKSGVVRQEPHRFKTEHVDVVAQLIGRRNDRNHGNGCGLVGLRNLAQRVGDCHLLLGRCERMR